MTIAQIAKRRFDERLLRHSFSGGDLPKRGHYSEAFRQHVPEVLGMDCGTRQPGVIEKTYEFDDGSHLDILVAGAAVAW